MHHHRAPGDRAGGFTTSFESKPMSMNVTRCWHDLEQLGPRRFRCLKCGRAGTLRDDDGMIVWDTAAPADHAAEFTIPEHELDQPLSIGK